MSIIVSVKNLSKEYQLREGRPYYTLRDNLTEMLQNPLSMFKRSKKEKFWALKDVSFDVEEGEILGILGNNGAGKSTLLKLLSRVTPPTQGEIILRGRLGSLLEVGTGFHPELTGRENIYLNGAILGMSRLEVQRQFSTIVEFAEVEKFLDTPMKHYSSGMYMRLAFAVAAHLESEIILIDEVLAVGDVEFQKKCLGKMDDISKQGRTILFVSHNIGAVSQLCTRCIVLEKGRLAYSGPTEKAVNVYLEKAHTTLTKGNIKDAPRNGNTTFTARMEKIELFSSKKEDISTVDTRKPFEIDLTFRALEDVRTGIFFQIKDENRKPVLFFSSGHLQGKDFPFAKGKHKMKCLIDAPLLTSGRYSVDCGLLYPNREIVDFVEDALFFTVTNSDPYKVGFDYSQHWGSYSVNHTWKEV